MSSTIYHTGCLPVTLGSHLLPAAERHDLGKGLTISKQSFWGIIRNSTKVVIKQHQKQTGWTNGSVVKTVYSSSRESMLSSSTHIKWFIISHNSISRGLTTHTCTQVHVHIHYFLNLKKKNPEKLYTYVDSTYSSLDLFSLNKHPFTVDSSALPHKKRPQNCKSTLSNRLVPPTEP